MNYEQLNGAMQDKRALEQQEKRLKEEAEKKEYDKFCEDVFAFLEPHILELAEKRLKSNERVRARVDATKFVREYKMTPYIKANYGSPFTNYNEEPLGNKKRRKNPVFRFLSVIAGKVPWDSAYRAGISAAEKHFNERLPQFIVHTDANVGGLFEPAYYIFIEVDSRL